MESLNFQQQLHALDHWEQKRFRKFVDSPYFNTDPKLLNLLDAIYQATPTEPLNYHQLHVDFFPDILFKKARITHLISYLKKLFHQFLQVEALQESPVSAELLLLQRQAREGWEKPFWQTHARLEKHLTADHLTDTNHHLWRYLSAEEAYTFKLGQGKREVEKSIEDKIVSLEVFFVQNTLRNMCQWVNQHKILQAEISQEKIDHFLTYLKPRLEAYHAFPLIRLYYLVLILQQNEAAETYFQFKKALYTTGPAIPKAEALGLYQHALNFCIKQINLGQSTFIRESLDLYQDMLVKELVFVRGYISPTDVKNMVTLGVRVKDFAWTASFLHDIADKISPDQRKGVLAYNQAYLLHHGQGASRQAMKLLVDLEIEDVFYYLGAKTLLLKIYYELADQEGLLSLIHAFEQSLRRNQLISQYQRKTHLNLLVFVKKLNQLRTQKWIDHPQNFLKAAEKLRNRIDRKREIANINWLREKISELESVE
ncbi:MAG: hypothetical protein AAFR61_05095 [Bacteroidota bacterium]